MRKGGSLEREEEGVAVGVGPHFKCTALKFFFYFGAGPRTTSIQAKRRASARAIDGFMVASASTSISRSEADRRQRLL
jgi:hypothetical protein